MLSTSAQRRTQFNFAAIAPADSPIPLQSKPNAREAIDASRNVDSTGLRRLILVEAASSDTTSFDYTKPIQGSPWEMYEEEYQLRLGEGNFITVAQRKDMCPSVSPRKGPLSRLVLVKMIPEHKLHMLQRIRHASFISALQVFKSESEFHVIFEYLAVPLSNVAGNPCLTENRLAAIVGQILNGLIDLEANALEHGSLTSSNILLHPHGNVKIVAQENCVPLQKSGHRDIRALSSILMELMQGYAKESGIVGIDNPRRWSSVALSFLGETTSASSAAQLMEHPFLQVPWRREDLIGLVAFVSVASRISYRYPPE